MTSCTTSSTSSSSSSSSSQSRGVETYKENTQCINLNTDNSEYRSRRVRYDASAATVNNASTSTSTGGIWWRIPSTITSIILEYLLLLEIIPLMLTCKNDRSIMIRITQSTLRQVTILIPSTQYELSLFPLLHNLRCISF